MKKYNEKMITHDGKMVYAISLRDKGNSDSDRNHIIIRNGEIYFSDSWYSGTVEFDFNDNAHKIAKEIFVSQLQVDIKRRIFELKQLEEIFESIGLNECISDSIISNSKILLDLKQEIKKETKQEINNAIESQVRSIARKKVKEVKNDRK